MREEGAEMTMDRGDEPVACTLTSVDLAAQRQGWERLAARAMTERVETADGLRVVFRPEPGAEEELRALVAVENGCCRWACWTVEAGAGQIVLAVRAAGDGITALHGMFTGISGSRRRPGGGPRHR
jgi:hypothetical protein